jgi:3-(3-hydroxy-phenyl)propionate hydroxylase
VLTGQAGEDLLATYDPERRPHARAMIKKAVRVGWAMTGGQDRAAAVRRVALAAAVRSARLRDAMAATATPRLKTGALQHTSRRSLLAGMPAALRPGGLIPNALVTIGDGAPVRLDAILAGGAAVLTGRRPDAELVGFCHRHGLVLVQISNTAPNTGKTRQPGAGPDTDRIGIRLVADRRAAGLQVLATNPALTVIVRPDRVIAAVEGRDRLPRLPWLIPEPALRTRPARVHPLAQTDPAGRFPTAP